MFQVGGEEPFLEIVGDSGHTSEQLGTNNKTRKAGHQQRQRSEARSAMGAIGLQMDAGVLRLQGIGTIGHLVGVGSVSWSFQVCSLGAEAVLQHQVLGMSLAWLV